MKLIELDCQNLMNKKISETRLKDSLLSLRNSIEDLIKSKEEEQKNDFNNYQKLSKDKLNDLENEIHIELGISIIYD